MAISDWPASERPRERLLQRGAATLSDAELLAIFLRTGTRGRSAVDLARELLHHFGGLRELLEADREQFCSAHGLGTAKYAQLAAVLEMANRHLESRLQRGEALTNPELTRRYLSSRLRNRAHESFALLYLDNRHRIIQFETLFVGTIDGAAVHPREVVRAALRHHAAAVSLSHNHLSGQTEPSAADLAITRKLQQALEVVEIRVLDHIIVGDGSQTTSLAERGLL